MNKSGLIAVAFALVFGVSVMAQTAVSTKVNFYLEGKIGSELVKKGTYKVEYTESDQGTIDIRLAGKVLTVPFTKKQNDNEAEADRVTYVNNDDGTRTISTITPRGRNYTLVLEGSGTIVANKK